MLASWCFCVGGPAYLGRRARKGDLTQKRFENDSSDKLKGRHLKMTAFFSDFCYSMAMSLTFSTPGVAEMDFVRSEMLQVAPATSSDRVTLATLCTGGDWVMVSTL